MKKPMRFKLIILLTMAGQAAFGQCPLVGSTVTVTNNSGANVNGSFAWALDCLDNAGSTLTTVQFDIDGATEIKPNAAAALVVNKAGASINGTNLGSGGAIIIDGTSVAGPSPNGIILAQANVTVQDLTFRNFTASAGGNGILMNGSGGTVQNNTVTGNRIGIATGSTVFTFTMQGNTVGASSAGNLNTGISISGSPTAGVIADNEISFTTGAGINILGGTVLITDNRIFCNTGSGITRPTPPALPLITLANTQMVRGTAAAGRVIEVFVYSTAGCSGTPVQGKALLGTVTTPGTGIWTLPLLAGSVVAGNQVTATSTQNGNNTSAFAAPFTVSDCSTFSATINQTNVSCNGGNNGTATTLPNNPSFNYAWEHGPVTAAINNLTAGTYTVTVTDAAGCTASQSATITEPALLTSTITPTNVACNGGSNGSALASPAGGTPGYNFTWNNGQTTASASGLAAGTYTVTVTDQNSCTTTQTTSITQPSVLNVAVNSTNVSCFGGSNGSAVATPSGGSAGYNFTWSNGQNAGTATALSVGTYTVTVTDQAGCSKTQTASITQPTAITLQINASNETASGNDGTAAVTPGGGASPFSYLWNTGQMTALITGLNAGIYTVTVTDQNGCTKTGSATVSAGPAGACTALPVYALLAPAQVCANTSFSLEADDLYPNAAVLYVWLFPNGDSAKTTLPTLELTASSGAFSGSYFVLRDSAGCRSVAVGGAPVSVLSVDNLFAGNDTVLCNPGTVVLQASLPSAGTGSWRSLGGATVDNPGQNNTLGRNLQPGRNLFIWEVNLGICPQAGTDTVVYFLENKPFLQDDHYTLQRAYDIAVMEILLNDALGGLSDTTLLQVSSPGAGNLELLEETRRFRYTVDEDFRGNVTFQYAVCNPNSVCNLPCDTATVTIEVQNMPTVPTGLVVEDPGPNGALTIRGVNGFTRVEITITDRWGDLVFTEKDYDNGSPWVGNYKRIGQYLPGGAYYYFLKAYDGDTQIGDAQTGVIHLFDKQN